jgi:ethanolamine ammonia-lyase large subunit
LGNQKIANLGVGASRLYYNEDTMIIKIIALTILMTIPGTAGTDVTEAVQYGIYLNKDKIAEIRDYSITPKEKICVTKILNKYDAEASRFDKIKSPNLSDFLSIKKAGTEAVKKAYYCLTYETLIDNWAEQIINKTRLLSE